MNNETQKTLVFVGVAAVLTMLAIFWSPGSQVRTPDYAANIGESFYPDFENPNEATSMRVAVFESDNAQVKEFAVELKDGQWSIPSHHNYPAEGKDRLSNTAASVIGIKRQALAGRRESDFKRLGVIDPLGKKDSEIEGVGRRVTLLDEANNPLCDYIIGDSIEGKPKSFYVRRPDKKQTYVAELEIDLSTNFTDWIQPDLLKVESDDIKQVYLNKYSFDERSGKRVDESLLQLKKETTDEGKTSWKLDGLKAETEELQETQITDLVNELNNLKIVGVRPKPPGLSADLKLNQGIQLDLMTQVDLQTKGFFFQRFPDGGQGLSSNEGELLAVTNDGITYVLYFGEVFTGSEFDIEVGLDKPKKDEEDADKSDEKNEEKSNDEGLKKSRYVFVTVSFDPEILGEKPKKPEKPKESTEKDDEKSSEKSDSKEKADDKKEEDKSDEKTEDKEESDEKKEDPKFEYEKALGKYKNDLQTYQTRLDTAKKTVQELNERFADWYYVISADSFDKLNISREKLVKEKEKPKAEEKPKTEDKAKEKTPKTSEKMKVDAKKDSGKKDEKKADPKAKSKDLPKIEPGKPGSSTPKKEDDTKKKIDKSAPKESNAPQQSDDQPKMTKDKKESSKSTPKEDNSPQKSDDQPKVEKKAEKEAPSKEKPSKEKSDKE